MRAVLLILVLWMTLVPSVALSQQGAPGQAQGLPVGQAAPLPDVPLPGVKLAPGEAACLDRAPAQMSCVPGGPFVRGDDARDANARPRALVTLSTYYMDQREVTVAAYRACVASGKCEDNGAGPRYRGYDDPAQPITGVSWFDAARFCEAHGKQLPTEAQWEKAARGPDGALYPWGDEPVSCARAIIEDARGRGCGVLKPGSTPEAGRIYRVASRPQGVYGLYDMIGNAQEWTADWYSPSYEACGVACQGRDPRGPCDGAKTCKGHRKRVLRGGGWYWPAAHATAIHRRDNVPSNRPYHHFGFRCAATLPQARALNQGAR